MEKVLCCPNCKSEDLRQDLDDKNALVCGNCEYTFQSLRYLEKKYKNLKLIFNLATAILIISLVVAVGFLLISTYIYNGIAADFVSAFLLQLNLNLNVCLVVGVGCFVLAMVSVFVLFGVRQSLGNIIHSRQFLRKRGYKTKEDESNIN